jgi:hypothetical protein
MASKKKVFLGCLLAAGLVLFLSVLLVGGLIVYVTVVPEGFTVKVDGVAAARQGQEVELIVHVANERDSKPLQVSRIEISEDYFKGFNLVSTDPEMKSYMTLPLTKTRSFKFNVTVPPRQEKLFKFRLRPVQAGVFKGKVVVVEGLRSVDAVCETEVK